MLYIKQVLGDLRLVHHEGRGNVVAAGDVLQSKGGAMVVLSNGALLQLPAGANWQLSDAVLAAHKPLSDEQIARMLERSDFDATEADFVVENDDGTSVVVLLQSGRESAVHADPNAARLRAMAHAAKPELVRAKEGKEESKEEAKISAQPGKSGEEIAMPEPPKPQAPAEAKSWADFEPEVAKAPSTPMVPLEPAKENTSTVPTPPKEEPVPMPPKEEPTTPKEPALPMEPAPAEKPVPPVPPEKPVPVPPVPPVPVPPKEEEPVPVPPKEEEDPLDGVVLPEIPNKKPQPEQPDEPTQPERPNKPKLPTTEKPQPIEPTFELTPQDGLIEKKTHFAASVGVNYGQLTLNVRGYINELVGSKEVFRIKGLTQDGSDIIIHQTAEEKTQTGSHAGDFQKAGAFEFFLPINPPMGEVLNVQIMRCSSEDDGGKVVLEKQMKFSATTQTHTVNDKELIKTNGGGYSNFADQRDTWRSGSGLAENPYKYVTTKGHRGLGGIAYKEVSGAGGTYSDVLLMHKPPLRVAVNREWLHTLSMREQMGALGEEFDEVFEELMAEHPEAEYDDNAMFALIDQAGLEVYGGYLQKIYFVLPKGATPPNSVTVNISIKDSDPVQAKLAIEESAQAGVYQLTNAAIKELLAANVSWWQVDQITFSAEGFYESKSLGEEYVIAYDSVLGYVAIERDNTDSANAIKTPLAQEFGDDVGLKIYTLDKELADTPNGTLKPGTYYFSIETNNKSGHAYAVVHGEKVFKYDHGFINVKIAEPLQVSDLKYIDFDNSYIYLPSGKARWLQESSKLWTDAAKELASVGPSLDGVKENWTTVEDEEAEKLTLDSMMASEDGLIRPLDNYLQKLSSPASKVANTQPSETASKTQDVAAVINTDVPSLAADLSSYDPANHIIP